MSETVTETPSVYFHSARERELLETVNKRVEAMKRDRKRFEPVWHETRAFAAGRQWHRWLRTSRKLGIPEKDKQRERYVADMLGQYIDTFAALLLPDDPVPDVTFLEEAGVADEFAEHTNKALRWGWENEWLGDEVLDDIVLGVIVDGTSAGRCRLDRSTGPVVASNVPHVNGRAVFTGPAAEGGYGKVLDAYGEGDGFELKDVRATIRWDALSAFGILVPPGIEHDRDFPYHAVIAPFHIDALRDEFGKRADGLVPENLAAAEMLGVRDHLETAIGRDGDASAPGKLEDHVLVAIYYEEPRRKTPKGRVGVVAQGRLLHEANELSYKAPDGTYRSGTTFFRGRKMKGQWWANGLIQPGVDPQRAKNRRRTQMGETLDVGQPKTWLFGEESVLRWPQGQPGSVGVLNPNSLRVPIQENGIGFNAAMVEELRLIDTDLERAVGLRAPSLGENPANVKTYSQLRLLLDSDQHKINKVFGRVLAGIRHMTEDTVYLMREHWPPEKHIALEGDEDQLEAFVYNASQIPDFYRVRLQKGTKSRTPATEVAKIEAIWNAALAIRQPLPLKWFVDSLDADQPLPLPEMPVNDHVQRAQWENYQLAQGVVPAVAEYDDHEIDIPIHRSLQMQARMVGNTAVDQACELHIQQHVQVARAAAARVAGEISPGPPAQEETP